jgi:outer membrane lipoprotein-sorting protein
MTFIRSLLVVIVLLWLMPSRAMGSFVPSAFKVEFEQVQVSSLTKRERKSAGEMKYKAPNKLFFSVSSPDEVVFVTDGVLTYYYTPPFIEGEAGELTIQESSDNVLSRFFGSLSHGLATNPSYAVEKKSGKQALIKFEETIARDLGVKTAEFFFKGSKQEFSQIQKIHLAQLDGTELTLNFKKIQTDIKLDDTVFDFTPPANTKINR